MEKKRKNSSKRKRREMAFWHEGCGAALYANFSRFLFVEREREMTRPLLFPKEKYLHRTKKKRIKYTQKNGGGNVWRHCWRSFVSSPVILFFDTCTKHINIEKERKKKKIYTRRAAAAMDVFPPTSSSYSFVTQNETESWPNRFFLKYKTKVFHGWTTLAPASCPVLH